MKSLQQMGFKNVCGVDISPESIRLCRQIGIESVSLADAANLNFCANSFDVIVASDILEHIEKDDEALKNWQRILKPNGKLLVFVPALKVLWSHHDVLNHHCRRYQKKTLVGV